MARKGESIYKRKDGRWEARYVKHVDEFGKKHIGSVYSKTYIGAKNKRIEAMRNTLSPSNTPKNSENLTLSALLHDWLEFRRPQLKTSSCQKYEAIIRNHIDGYIGKRRVEEMDGA